MPKRVLQLNEYLDPDNLAQMIALQYDRWAVARRKKEKEWAELRNYIFATDTSTTTNNILPWKNRTTRPKLCQIRDNLHANYMAALFPNDNWIEWEADDEDSAAHETAEKVKTYIKNKVNLLGFKQEVSKLVYDFIDYGNCFADVEYINERHDSGTGVPEVVRAGPIVRRISPLDIVFDITSNNFREAPKITRQLLGMGDVAKMITTLPEWAPLLGPAFNKAVDAREHYKSFIGGDIRKSEGFVADGFNSIDQYYTSNYVELLIFEGDLYDPYTKKLYENHQIAVMDRAWVVYMGPIKNWFGRALKEHAGWRLRPDNIWAMGPLDNLVGMQYRIDHLENLKADVFDQIAYPVLKCKGYVEDFVWQPGERIYVGEEGDVAMLVPDTTALNADMQIQVLEREMEEMAGAPKQAMGIRTPGEKTAYEVQQLENAASRIFQSKITYFEENFIEPLLNSMLEIARRNLDGADLIKVLDPDLGVVRFLEVTREDITAKGKLRPRGARHFAAQAQMVQNLTGFANSPIYMDPGVRPHLSGKRIANLMVESLGLESKELYEENIQIVEQVETQRLAQAAQEQLMTEQAMPMTPPMNEQEESEVSEAQ